MNGLKNILSQFTQRKSHPFVQFVKYGLAGIVATGVHSVTFYALAWLVFPAMNADDIVVRLFNMSVPDLSDAVRARNAMINNTIAFMFSNMTAYLINVKWVFESGRHHKALEIGMFYLVSGASLFAGTLLMGVLINYFAVSTTVSFAAVVVVSVLVNYAMRKYVIFKG